MRFFVINTSTKLMKREIFLLQICICFAVSSPAQSDRYIDEDYNVNNFRTIKIRSPSTKQHIKLSNIISILVIDARPDTTSLGFMQKHALNHAFVVLNKSLKQEIEKFVHDYLGLTEDTASLTLVMILKKIWLSDEISKDESKLNEKVDDAKASASGAIAKIEFYLKYQSDYYPLYRYDSVILEPYLIADFGTQFLEIALTSSLDKLIKMDKAGFGLNKRKLSWADIDQFNNERFNISILKDRVLIKGAYRTFEEFKTNSPSEKIFEIAKDKKNDIFYIRDSSGKNTVTRNIWGYCDGKNVFINSINNYFQLQRKGNSFYFYGSKNSNISQHRNSAVALPMVPLIGFGTSAIVTGIINHHNKIKYGLYLKPFVLDWDTGQLY